MTLTIDNQLEQRIQNEMELGNHRSPADVIAHALDLLEDSRAWSDEEKAELESRLAESMEQVRRGQVYTAEEAAQLLDQRIAERRASIAS